MSAAVSTLSHPVQSHIQPTASTASTGGTAWITWSQALGKTLKSSLPTSKPPSSAVTQSLDSLGRHSSHNGSLPDHHSNVPAYTTTSDNRYSPSTGWKLPSAGSIFSQSAGTGTQASALPDYLKPIRSAPLDASSMGKYTARSPPAALIRLPDDLPPSYSSRRAEPSHSALVQWDRDLDMTPLPQVRRFTASASSVGSVTESESLDGSTCSPVLFCHTASDAKQEEEPKHPRPLRPLPRDSDVQSSAACEHGYRRRCMYCPIPETSGTFSRSTQDPYPLQMEADAETVSLKIKDVPQSNSPGPPVLPFPWKAAQNEQAKA